MKNYLVMLVWVIIPLVFFVIVGIQESFAEDSDSFTNVKSETKNGIKLEVMTDKRVYLQNEVIKIKTVLQNISTEPIGFFPKSSCSNGIEFEIYGEKIGRKAGHPYVLLPDYALLVDENDPVLEKINYEFYGRILKMINDGNDREYSIIPFSNDTKTLKHVLINKHSAKTVEGQTLSFFAASVPVSEILKIAQYDFVLGIGDGEDPQCAFGSSEKFLYPNEKREKEHVWSHLLPVGESKARKTPLDSYVVKGAFDDSSKHIRQSSDRFSVLLPFEIVEKLEDATYDESLLKRVSSIGNVPSWFKENAKWWHDGTIDDESFLASIQFLINEGVIWIPNTSSTSEIIAAEIPTWLRNGAGWWYDGYISDREFISALQYLVKYGIIVLK